MAKQLPFLNFQVDHMTLLVEPKLYNLCYVIFRIIFGASREDIIYEKRKEWRKNLGEASMTFAVRVGRGTIGNSSLQNTIIALVQPSEPEDQPSHVREMIRGHLANAHWQHIALRTSDLLSFHQFALQHGVNFITPILRDEDEDLIQAFTGEWYLPNEKPSGMFFEFVQREPSASLLKRLEERNRESWFRDKTFLGLYEEKEKEYQSKKIKPFIDHELTLKLLDKLGTKHVWEISEDDLCSLEEMMTSYVKAKQDRVFRV